MHRPIVLFLVMLTLSACATVSLVEVTPQRIADRYTVMPQRTWSRLRTANAEMWTVDGYGLQSLRFFDPLDDGDALLESRSEDKMPTYRKGMIANEIQEFVVDTLSRAGAQQISVRELAPARFGSLDGFRFELDMLSGDGLELSALVMGAIADGRLYLITYTGARAHYFPRYKPQVERILASIRTDA